MKKDNEMPMELSIVIPTYNEENNIQPLYQELCRTFENTGISFEVIFVDDGSKDQSLEIIKQLSEHDCRVRYASFSRNFGHEAASSCGFRMVRGKAAVLMDADMQDPPGVIHKMISKWKEGYEVVYARRLSREAETFLKKFTSRIFYKVMNRLSSVKIPADVGDFRLVDRKAVDTFNSLGERNRFVRGLFPWVGYKQASVDYQRLPRRSGKTKYNWLRLILLSMDAVFGFSLVPLRLCILFGLCTVLFSFIMGSVIVLQRMFFGLALEGYALLTTGMFFLGGVQLTFLGVMGEYIGKIYTEVQARPLYVVKEGSHNSGGEIG